MKGCKALKNWSHVKEWRNVENKSKYKFKANKKGRYVRDMKKMKARKVRKKIKALKSR